MTDGELTAAASGVFALGRNVAVTRLGLRAGSSADRDTAIGVLRRAAQVGVDFIDTAGQSGPAQGEDIVREALHPYQGLTVATHSPAQAGPGQPDQTGTLAGLRQSVEASLRRLSLDTIELYQVRLADAQVPVADQLGTLDELRREGKIRHIGLCEVAVDEIAEARLTAPVASVQNAYHLADRRHEVILDYCEREGLGFLPCSALASSGSARRFAVPRALAQLARQTGTSPAQLALAWLLRRSPVMLPVPGTGSLAHLEENVAAAELELTDEEFRALSEVAAPAPG